MGITHGYPGMQIPMLCLSKSRGMKTQRKKEAVTKQITGSPRTQSSTPKWQDKHVAVQGSLNFNLAPGDSAHPQALPPLDPHLITDLSSPKKTVNNLNEHPDSFSPDPATKISNNSMWQASLSPS